jgi:hypothetical protein
MWKKTKEYSSRQLRRAGVVIDNATGQVVGTIGGLTVAGSAMALPVDLTSLSTSRGRLARWFCTHLKAVNSHQGRGTPLPAFKRYLIMSSYDAWYLVMFAFGQLCAWAVIKGSSE